MNTEELKVYLKQVAEMERTVMTLGHLRDTQKLYSDAYRHLGNPKEYERLSPKHAWCDMKKYPFLQTQPQDANKAWCAVFNKADRELSKLSVKRHLDYQHIRSLAMPTKPEPVPYVPMFTKKIGPIIVPSGLGAGLLTLILSFFTGNFGLSLIVGIIVFVWFMRELDKTAERQLEKAREYATYQRAHEKYESDLKAYNEQEERFNTACRNANAELLNEYTALIQQRERALSDSLSENEAQLQKAKSTLEQLYAMNILHPKYRNFIAVSMLLEYFETERCDSLTGVNGAYNLFESELRQNLIILKLDEIVERLDKLQATMYNCCTALKTLNKQMNRVQGQLNSISVTMNEQLEVQQQTLQLSAATTMYSAATAANTEALKYIALVS